MEKEVVTKDRYFVTVEVQGYYGSRLEQYMFSIARGNLPVVKDFIALFKEKLNLDTELKDLAPYMVFAPKEYQPKGVQFIRVVRVVKDYTFAPVTRI